MRMLLPCPVLVLQVSRNTWILLLSFTKHIYIKHCRKSRARVLARLLELPPGLL
jgi:hypothetical protein